MKNDLPRESVMTDQGGQSRGLGVVDYRRTTINQESEVGESQYEMDADETGMEFPTVDLTASRIKKKMNKKHQDKLKKMKKSRQ
jgi:hypothetical protein